MDEKEEFRNEFAALAIAEGVEPRYADSYYELVFEVAIGLISRGEVPLMLGIAGAQGTGKSTFAKMLAICFERVFEKTTLVMSLDDFYLTRSERARLARDVHPLLAVRGVPGTHDTNLLRQVIGELKAGRNTDVPVFNKASDDRESLLPVMAAGLDLLVVEGWCFGARPVAESDLAAPINELEAERDPDGAWRHHVNAQLATGGYREVFAEADVCFFLAAPSMASVFQWRWQQERRLAERMRGVGVMNEAQVREFIMYYERITRQMLSEMPARANLTLYLNERHQIVRPPQDLNSA